VGIHKLCKGCGKPIIVLTNKTKYCSDTCRRKSYYKKKPLLRVICKNCYTQFTTRRSTQVFCCVQCKNEYHKQDVMYENKCKYCGKTFSTTDSKRKYCCGDHYLAQKRINDNMRYMKTMKRKIEGYNI
jgi:hypothetical protein